MKMKKCYIKKIENNKESEEDLLFHLPIYRQKWKIWEENISFFENLEKDLKFSY